jgi:hypothetical protein
MGGGFAELMVLAYLFAIVLLVLWCVLPFAVFGIKGRLDKLLEEQRRTNELLAQLLRARGGA